MARTQVQSELIATNAISGTIIADGAITSTHLAANSVDTAELVTGSIDTIHIAANQVTAAKIVSDGIETRHLHSNVISGLSAVTAASGDYVLIGDTSDSNNLKKALVSDFGNDLDAAVTINESGAAVDFRVEGDTEQNLFFVDGSADKIGIGTASPNNTLDVNGGIVCSPNTDGKDTFELSTNAVNEGRLRIKNVDTTTVQIRAGGDSYFNGGNVGIGTTSPTTLLEISGDTTTWAGMSKIYLTDVNSNASSRNWSIGNGGTAFGSLSFITSNAADGVPADSTGTAVMSMDGVNKKVGINLAAPTTYLDVRAPSGVSAPNVAYFKSDQHGLGVYVNIGSTFSEIRSNNNSYALVLNASSGGNVGIGTTDPKDKLHVNIGTNLNWQFGYPSSSVTTLAALNDAESAYVEARIDALTLNLNSQSGGKVGIGTTSPSEPLTVRSSGENVNTTLIEIGNDLHATNTKDAWMKFVGGAAMTDNSWAIGQLSDTFRIVQLGARGTTVSSGTERFRINHLGRQGYNGSASYNAHGNFVGEVGAGYKALSFERTVGGGEVGSIVANASSTTYNTSSDYRLKENIDYSWDATTRLKQLKPARFNWIKDDTNTLLEGFLAHEVSSIVPEAVSGEKDAMTDPVLWGTHDIHPLPEGIKVGDVKTAPVPDYQSIDQSKLVPLLVKTVQELEARIKTLEDA